MVSLEGKRVLLFSPYGATIHYGEAIKKELEKRGAIVHGYDERPSQSVISKIVIRLFKKKVPQIFDHYIQSVINKEKDFPIDYCLICRGEAFTPKTIELLRTHFPNAKVILYFWDILSCADVRDNIPYADRAMSFDPQDVEENEGLEYRPTFFVNDYLNVASVDNAKYDVCFIGSMRPNRYKIIKQIDAFFDSIGLRFYKYLYVPSRLVYIKDFITHFPYIGIKQVQFTPLSLEGNIKVLADSKAIFDINNPVQKSLSTRAYEAMAAKRKYITTNPEVKKYDFYHPQNIAVVDMDNPQIDRTFFTTPFHDVAEEVMRHYSVAGLVDDLFIDI